MADNKENVDVNPRTLAPPPLVRHGAAPLAPVLNDMSDWFEDPGTNEKRPRVSFEKQEGRRVRGRRRRRLMSPPPPVRLFELEDEYEKEGCDDPACDCHAAE
jgi:hypothetical protein